MRRGNKPERVLQERVEELDSGKIMSGFGRSFILRHRDPREHFADVMESWTDAVAEERVDSEIPIDPAVADAIVANSALLKEIAASDPCLVVGPMDRRRQRWTPRGLGASTGEAPSRARFVAVDHSRPVRVKPSQFGLYTSTGTSTGPSMWRLLLGPGGPPARPLGRFTWALDVEQNARVAEIVTASDWVELVCEHPFLDGDQVLPDWANISRRFDAVHLTLPVIAALQALSVRAGDAMIPAAYWDVETTFWLNWRFSGVHLLESPNP